MPMPSSGSHKARALLTTVSAAVFAAVLLARPLLGHDLITTKLTYTRDISRIFAQHCVSCHADGTAIPLTTYAQVRPWAVAIKEKVLSRAMPPWGAVPGFGNLAPDRALSEEDLLIISAWVVGGAPQGDPALAPQTAPEPQPPPPNGPLTALVVVNTRLRLTRSITIQGLRPLPETRVPSAKVVAALPGGRVEALIWLYGYEPAWKTLFRFAKPITLPEGTEVRSSVPLVFELCGNR
jgi:mono/diheme cytochrome c family protein